MTDQATFRAAAHAQISRASHELTRTFLKGAVEAVVFAASTPVPLAVIARTVGARRKLVAELLVELGQDYAGRGIQLAETHGGFTFFTSPTFRAVVRQITGKKPVRMSRAQLETLAIVAYRQPVTRPEIDEVRGVDCGPVLRTLLDRELVRILGKKEEPGRALLYGTTNEFLALFSLRSLGELPTLREFTELSDDSRHTYERKLGEAAPFGAIEFDDEPEAAIDPTVPFEGEIADAAAAGPPPEGSAPDDDEPDDLGEDAPHDDEAVADERDDDPSGEGFDDPEPE
jgi:segregation and condensation protein B